MMAAISGMKAAQTALGVSAHNIANVNTPGFQRQNTVQTAVSGGGVEARVAPTRGGSLENDTVGQIEAKNEFLANVSVFKTHDQMAGTLLDLSA